MLIPYIPLNQDSKILINIIGFNDSANPIKLIDPILYIPDITLIPIHFRDTMDSIYTLNTNNHMINTDSMDLIHPKNPLNTKYSIDSINTIYVTDPMNPKDSIDSSDPIYPIDPMNGVWVWAHHTLGPEVVRTDVRTE